ncbi:hypothetical protein MBRA_04536 [Methylobacterium brachiatum]|nr:hypothetical protein MBRA_04536 [Methylobacterium brachiatum]
MLLNALVLLTGLMPAVEDRAATLMAAPSATAAPAEAAPPRFDPATRSVSNWHVQAGESLLPRALALTARLAEDPPYVARCVRLNNGWCIKSARWPGEIGADAEGHTAFATLADGADAAASLLRRYFRDYGRRNALAIVRRWAPSECRVATPARAGRGSRPGSRRQLSRRPWRLAGSAGPCAPASSPPTGRAAFPGRGLRPAGAALVAARPDGRPARGTSGRRPRAARGDAPAGARHRCRDRGLGRIPADGRAPGAADPAALLDRKLPSPDRMVAESAQLPAIAAGLPLLDLRLPAPLCTGDEVRIQAYAARISGSVGLKPGDDLDLFGPDGTPRPNLAPVMLAMSAVELGTLRAGPELVAGAIARLKPTTPTP